MKKIFTLIVALVATVTSFAQMQSSMNFIGNSSYSATVGTMTISGNGSKDTLVVSDANTAITYPAMTVSPYGTAMTVPAIKIANLTYTMTGNPMQGNAVFTWDKADIDTVINFPGQGDKTVKISSLHAVYTLATRQLETTISFQYGSMPGVVTFSETGYYTPSNDWNLVGQGTAANPYRIFDADDFAAIASNISETNTGSGKYFQMMNDIDFGGTAENAVQLPAIGKAAITNITTVAYGFQGIFDGDNKTITGIYHTNKANDANGKFNALFSSLGEDGTIKNLIFGENNSISTYNYGAAFVSINKGGNIENCVNNAPVTAANAFCAGICGYIVGGKGTVKNCVNKGNITASTYAAGICGGSQSGAAVGTKDADYTQYIIDGCTNSGDITSATGTAGIAGALSGMVTNNTNTGAVTGTKDNIGGIVSCMTYIGGVSGNTNSGTVKGANNIGGIIGKIMKGSDEAFDVSENTNTGSVEATGANYGEILGASARTQQTVKPADDPTAVTAVAAQGNASAKTYKVLRNNSLMIINGNKQYNAAGAQMK